MKEWKKLDIGNLPSDILVGDYEFLYAGRLKVYIGIIAILEKGMKNIAAYEYRKKETPPPTHEEIMTKWWEDKNRGWSKVIAYNKGNYMVTYYARPGGYETESHWKDWFIDKKSSDIPPEKEQS